MNVLFPQQISRGLFVIAVLAGPIALKGAEANWASFQNGGHVSLAEGDWTLDEKVAWSAPLIGYGQSSPVIWNERVYVTSVEGPEKETYHVTAYSLADGTQIWSHKLANASPRESNNYVSRAAPTPAADADGLICFFEGGNLIALTHDGQPRWEKNLVELYGKLDSRHGLAASVEQDDSQAYIWVERSEDPFVLALDKKSGEIRWKVKGLGATSWASPRLIPVTSEQRHLALSGSGHLVGLDPRNGEQLWSVQDISGNSTPTPIPLGEGRFLIGATVGRSSSDSGRAAESNGVIAITQDESGAWKADYLWRAKRATSSFSSPIAHSGAAYFVNKTGVLFGLDLKTGEEKFNKRLGGSVWATPIAVGERVLIFGKDGKVSLVTPTGDSAKITTWEGLPADPEPEEKKEEDRFGGSVVYSAVLGQDLLLLRRGDQLYAIKTGKP